MHALVSFYSEIFEYQARMICNLSKGPLHRAIRGTLKLDDWEGMLKTIQASDAYVLNTPRFHSLRENRKCLPENRLKCSNLSIYSDTFWRNLKTTNQADDETAKRTKKPSCFRHWRRTTRAIKISFLQGCLVHVNGFSTMKDFWSGGTARSREFFEFLRDLGVENLSCRDLLLMRRDSATVP